MTNYQLLSTDDETIHYGMHGHHCFLCATQIQEAP
jgi:hypothetical protein